MVSNSVWHGASLHVLLAWHSGCCLAVITVPQKDKWSRAEAGPRPEPVQEPLPQLGCQAPPAKA